MRHMCGFQWVLFYSGVIYVCSSAAKKERLFKSNTLDWSTSGLCGIMISD